MLSQVFFLAQRPYIFAGTLREQVAYPVWDPSLLQGLTDEKMEQLFREAALESVWPPPANHSIWTVLKAGSVSGSFGGKIVFIVHLQ